MGDFNANLIFPESRDQIDKDLFQVIQGLASRLETIFDGGIELGVDTNKTISDLAVTSDLVAGGMVRQGDTWHAYGGFQDESETITISAKDTWTHITNGANDLWKGLEEDGVTVANDVITFANAGDYFGQLSLTFSALNGKDFQVRIYNTTQSTQMGYVIGATTTGANNFTNVTLPLYLEIAAGDVLRFEIQCTTDGTDPKVKSAVYYVSYLHD